VSHVNLFDLIKCQVVVYINIEQVLVAHYIGVVSPSFNPLQVLMHHLQSTVYVEVDRVARMVDLGVRSSGDMGRVLFMTCLRCALKFMWP
jgi:hypothetical protein